MIKNFAFLLLLLNSLLLVGCATQQVRLSAIEATPASISLDGKWQFLSATEKDDDFYWQTIDVPANWYKAGFDMSGEAQYQKRFFVDTALQDKQITLEFKGVDYIADVWLNGQHIGQHEGYFQKFSFDATPFIRWGESNTLLVRVDSPLETAADFSLHKRLIKGIFSHHDTRPGGAWSDRGQERNTGGIWGSVALHVSEQAYAAQLKAIPQRIDNDHWQLVAAVDLQGKVPEGTEYHWQLMAKNHDAATVSGISNQASFEIMLTEPQLWWPIGFGKPNLYVLSIQVMHQNKVLDTIQTTTAFRQVELTENKVWKINGQRLILRGTNYIATQWLSEMSREKFARDIDLMTAANINAVRVHAHITAPEFYDLCDEKGVMIWQDFPLQWGYQDSTAFHLQAKSQVADMINQLGNHPSIIHWTLHNEPPWDAGWMKWKYPDYSPDQNKALDDRLYTVATDLDHSRPTSKYSATKEHPWLGWYSGHWLDYAKPTDQAFIAEFGAQALPSKAVLWKILKGNIRLPDASDAEREAGWKSWAVWQYHNFQPKETFEIAKVAVGENTDDLIRNTQQYQAQLNQLAAESYRRQAYQPVTALFQFMFVEDWESMNWGVVDYWRNTKPGYDSLKMAYQPILPSLEWSQVEYPAGKVEIGLWVLNDTLSAYKNVQYHISLLQHGKQINQQQYSVSVAFMADAHLKIESYHTPELRAGSYQILAKLVDQQGDILGHNEYNFTVK